MGNNAVHRIRKQTLDVEGPSGIADWDFRNRLVSAYYNKVKPALEAICEKYDVAEVHFRFEKIDLDLGNVPLEQLEEAFLARMTSQFEAYLQAQIGNKADAMAQNQEFQVLNRTTNEWDLLRSYLETGALPWYSAQHMPHPIATLLPEVLKTQATQLLHYLKGALEQRVILKRLMYYAPAKQLQALAHAHAPGAATYIAHLQNALQQLPAGISQQLKNKLAQGIWHEMLLTWNQWPALNNKPEQVAINLLQALPLSITDSYTASSIVQHLGNYLVHTHSQSTAGTVWQKAVQSWPAPTQAPADGPAQMPGPGGHPVGPSAEHSAEHPAGPTLANTANTTQLLTSKEEAGTGTQNEGSEPTKAALPANQDNTATPATESGQAANAQTATSQEAALPPSAPLEGNALPQKESSSPTGNTTQETKQAPSGHDQGANPGSGQPKGNKEAQPINGPDEAIATAKGGKASSRNATTQAQTQQAPTNAAPTQDTATGQTDKVTPTDEQATPETTGPSKQGTESASGPTNAATAAGNTGNAAGGANANAKDGTVAPDGRADTLIPQGTHDQTEQGQPLPTPATSTPQVGKNTEAPTDAPAQTAATQENTDEPGTAPTVPGAATTTSALPKPSNDDATRQGPQGQGNAPNAEQPVAKHAPAQEAQHAPGQGMATDEPTDAAGNSDTPSADTAQPTNATALKGTADEPQVQPAKGAKPPLPAQEQQQESAAQGSMPNANKDAGTVPPTGSLPQQQSSTSTKEPTKPSSSSQDGTRANEQEETGNNNTAQKGAPSANEGTNAPPPSVSANAPNQADTSLKSPAESTPDTPSGIPPGIPSGTSSGSSSEASPEVPTESSSEISSDPPADRTAATNTPDAAARPSSSKQPHKPATAKTPVNPAGSKPTHTDMGDKGTVKTNKASADAQTPRADFTAPKPQGGTTPTEQAPNATKKGQTPGTAEPHEASGDNVTNPDAEQATPPTASTKHPPAQQTGAGQPDNQDQSPTANTTNNDGPAGKPESIPSAGQQGQTPDGPAKGTPNGPDKNAEKPAVSYWRQSGKPAPGRPATLEEALKRRQEEYRRLQDLERIKNQKQKPATPGGQQAGTLPGSSTPQRKFTPQASDQYYINNAGLVILWPYVSRLFTHLELVKDQAFVSPEAREQAVHVLHYMATNQIENHPEPELVFPKLLCGLSPAEPIDPTIVLTQAQQEGANELLEAIVKHWTKLKGTSVQGLQGSFILRNGVLNKEPEHWLLQVEQKAYDMLLESLPWSISVVKMPWFDDTTIYVEW